MDPLKIGLIILAIILLGLNLNISGFTNISDLLNQNYKECNRENRVYPSGKVPGSYLGLTKAEKDNIFQSYVENDKYKI